MRVRVRIRAGGRAVTTTALINTGFETDEPQLIIPLKLAEELGISSAGARIEDFSTAGGGRVSGYRLGEAIEVELLLEDKPPVRARALATVLPGEPEVLVSDRLASELGVVVLDPWRGLWCVRDELGSRERPSAPPEEWEVPSPNPS